jgi:hypothetical protein
MDASAGRLLATTALRGLLTVQPETTMSRRFAGFGLKNALPTPESSQAPGLSMGSRLFRPNPQQRCNYLRSYNLQRDERVDLSATTCR